MNSKVQKKGDRRGRPIKLEMVEIACLYATALPRGALTIFPADRQEVQTLTLITFPPISIRATCRFGFQVRRVLLFACDTLFPNATPRAQE